MACLFIDSCGDHYDVAGGRLKYDVFNDVVISADGDGYNGGKCFNTGITPYTRVRAVKCVTPVPVHTVSFGFKLRADPGTFPIGGATFYILAAVHRGTSGFGASTKQLSINVLTNGELQVRRGNYDGTVLGATAAPVFENGVWVNVGIKVVVSATAGAVEIRKNGAAALLLTGLNTQALSTDAVGAVEFVPWTLDDCWINDLSGSVPALRDFMPGGFTVKVARPVANDAVLWVPSGAASNYDCVDDTDPDAGATKVTSQFAGDTDLYALETLTPDATLTVVQANCYGRRVSLSAAATIAAVVQIDGVRYVGPLVTPGTAMADLRTIWPVAPDDNQPWTIAKLNAARWGFSRVS